MAIEVVGYRPFKKNTLQAFLSLKLTQVGLTINDCTLHEKNGKRRVSMPAKSIEKDGKSVSWFPIVIFDKEINQVFQKAAVQAISDRLEKV